MGSNCIVVYILALVFKCRQLWNRNRKYHVELLFLICVVVLIPCSYGNLLNLDGAPKKEFPHKSCAFHDFSTLCRLARARRDAQLLTKDSTEPEKSAKDLENIEDLRDLTKKVFKPDSKSSSKAKESRSGLLSERFRTRWRYQNGRYFKLPTCNATVPPEINITTAPTDLISGPKPNFKTVPISPEARIMLLNSHNEARRNVVPAATDMRYITWDDELTWIAERMTNSCNVEERSVFNSLLSGFPTADIVRHSALNAEVGFNWFAWRGLTDLPSNFVETVMYAWMSEEEHYDFKNGRCRSVCQHFLQIIWAQTYKLGCSASFCQNYVINGIEWQDTLLLLCAYAPRGNVINYSKRKAARMSYGSPLKTRFPYTYGPTCADCGGSAETRMWFLGNETADTNNFVSTTIRPGDAAGKAGPSFDYCEEKLCHNLDRDKNINFKIPPNPTTTTFSWTTTIGPEFTTQGCRDPTDIEVQLEKPDIDITNPTVTPGSGSSRLYLDFKLLQHIYVIFIFLLINTF